jgi:hypothetical protein
MTATLYLAKLAQGQPYMIQYVGKEALKIADQMQSDTVTVEVVQSARSSLLKRSLDPFLEIRYQTAIGSSSHRESVLRAFAESLTDEGEVLIAEAYRVARFAGVSSPGRYAAQLAAEKFGAEIIRIRDNCYHFKEMIFAAYVNVRPRQFRTRSARGDLDSGHLENLP